jgi:hypothetical protein
MPVEKRPLLPFFRAGCSAPFALFFRKCMPPCCDACFILVTRQQRFAWWLRAPTIFKTVEILR